MNSAADDPETALVYEFLGDIFSEQQDIPKALEFYRRAVALKPGDENRRKYDETIDLSRGAAPKKPLSPPVRMAASTTPLPVVNIQPVAEKWSIMSVNRKPLRRRWS